MIGLLSRANHALILSHCMHILLSKWWFPTVVISDCACFSLPIFIFLIPTQQNVQLYTQRVHITSRKLPWTIARVYVSTIDSKIADSLCNVCAFTQPYKWEIDSPGTRKMTYMASTHLEPFLWESALYNYVGIRNIRPNREFLVMRNTHNRRDCFLVLSKVECVALLAWPLIIGLKLSQLVSICMSARPSAPIVWPKYSSKGSKYYISESWLLGPSSAIIILYQLIADTPIEV